MCKNHSEGVLQWWWKQTGEFRGVPRFKRRPPSKNWQCIDTTRLIQQTDYHLSHSLLQQLTRQDPWLYRLNVALRKNSAWKLINLPTLLNSFGNQDDVPDNAVQIVAPLFVSKKEGWEEGVVWAQKGEVKRKISRNDAVCIPCLVVVAEDDMTLEIPTFSFGDMVLSHLHLTTAGGTIS